MATEYEVNIKLNTADLKKDLDTVGNKIKDLGKTQNTKAKKALSNSDAVLKKEIAILATENRALRTKGQLLKLEKDGFGVKNQLKKLDGAINIARKGEVDFAKTVIQKQERAVILRKNQLVTETKITEQKQKQVALSTGIASPVFGKPSQIGSPTNIASILNNPLTSDSPVQQALKRMEDKTKSDQKQAILNRKKSLSLGKDIVKIKVDEGKATAKNLDLEGRQLEKQAQRLNAAISPQGAFSRLSDRQSRDREGRRTFMNNRFARAGLPMPTRGFDFQSALISGGFPLLFGQGPVTAAAGALGGGVGGMFGGMGGFAGGIAGTAIVSGIQQQITAVAQLGQAFNSITPNIQALTASLGIAGTEEERRLRLIEETQGRQAALAAVTERMNKAIGVDGVENLKRFGETSQLLANAFTLAMTKMQAALAPFFELLATPFVGQIREQKRNEQIAAGGGATDPTLLGLQEELAGIASTKQNRARRNRLKAQIEARKEELAELGKIEITAKNIRMIEDSKLKKIRQQNDLLKAKINGNFEEVQLAQEVEAKIQEMVEAGAKINEIDKQRVEDTLKLNKDLEKQAELAEKIRQSFKDLGQSIATDISDGIKGMIRGTSTLNDLLNNVMDKLIDTAFNMAFFGNPQGTLGGGGLFGSIFSGLGGLFGGSSGPPPMNPGFMNTGIPQTLSAGSFNITGQLANGGRAKEGKSYLVGERGPELFTPGVSGMVSPNSSLGGTTNVVVNVDASGSSVEGDEEQGRELGRIISAAIQSELIKQKRPGGMLA